MGCFVKLIVMLVVAQAAPSAMAMDNDWGRVASDFFNLNVVCSQCDDLCPRSVFTDGDASDRGRALHWACYIGCRTTCILQIGPDKYDYDTSKSMCTKGCRAEYESTPDNENSLSKSCIDGCRGKVVAPKLSAAELSRAYAQLDIEETETILFDPSLGIKSGGLPRSSYKTIPHKDSLVMYNSIKRQLGKPTNLDHLLTFIKDPSTDPTLAGAVAIPLILLLFATMCYLLYIVSVAKRERRNRRNRNVSREPCTSQSVTLLRVHLEPDEKKDVLSDFSMDDDFVPPPTPPPKYSDIVQTV